MGPICDERKKLLLHTTAQAESRCSDIDACPRNGAKPPLGLLSSPHWEQSRVSRFSAQNSVDEFILCTAVVKVAI